MRQKTAAKGDSAPRIAKATPWRVMGVEVIDNYRLRVRFADGTQGVVDVSRLVSGDRAGVFAALRDAEVFAQVRIDHGAVTWPGDLDLAPDAMYDEIKANGHWAVE